jgi:hypothetical protein
MADSADLYCFACAVKANSVLIKRYDQNVDDTGSMIGDLTPARAVEDGTTFWGHSSGDLRWWFSLPQHVDSDKETLLLRKERDYFCGQSDDYGKKWLDSMKRENQAVRDRDEAMRFAKLRDLPK